MKNAILAGLFALLATAAAAAAAATVEQFHRYDSAAVKRFDDELRRLGVALPSITKPDEPVDLPDPTVSSPAGDFEGYWTKSQFGRPIAAFEGIPYAQPPVGLLRFQVAKPLTSRLTNFQAKKPGSKCLQRNGFLATSAVEGKEDCLFINIYVPENLKRSTELLPVMFFVHGGGFVCGQGDHYTSNILLDRDVILVTFNYRLGSLGFLTTGDDVIPGNVGLKDQVAALHWVHSNIAAFGGNPNLITAFGHSAGGASVEFLMMSPLTRGLIKHVIALSGSSLAGWALIPSGEMKLNVAKAAKYLKCPAEPSKDLLDCMLTKTAEEIIETEFRFKVHVEKAPIMPFRPIIEGDIPGAYLPRHPAKLLTEDAVIDIPFMNGFTSEEGTFMSADMSLNETFLQLITEDFSENMSPMLFLTYRQEEKKVKMETLRRAYLGSGPIKRANALDLGNIISDTYFTWPSLKSAHIRNKRGKSPGYFYYFSFEGSRTFLQLKGLTNKYGVSHGDDLFYLFPMPGDLKPTAEDVLMSMIMTDIYSSFARNGIPSSNLIKTEWLPIRTEDMDIEYLEIKSPLDITMKKDLVPERWNLLEELFGKAGQQDHDEL